MRTAQFNRDHDTLLYYTKRSGTNTFYFNDINLPLSKEYIKKVYTPTASRRVPSENLNLPAPD